MDFLGPISPRCEATGAAYVLLAIDYFTRFVWVVACANVDQAAVHYFWITIIAPIFGWPHWLYTDNGTHFIGSETVALFESHGTRVIQAPISHPSSVGLIERNVQLVIAQVRRWCAEKGQEAKRIWGRSVHQIMPNINGRLLTFYVSAGYGSNREGLHQKYRHLSCDPGWISEKYGGGDFSPLRVQDDLGYWRRWQAYWINDIIHEKMFVQTWVRGQHSMSLTQDWIPCDRNKVSSKCPALFKSKLDLKAVLR